MANTINSGNRPSRQARLLTYAALCLAFLQPIPGSFAKPGDVAPPALPLDGAQADPIGRGGPSGLCEDAIHSVERQYGLPPRLLLAMGLVESGRADPLTGRVRPWPWSVQANDASYYFDTQAQAVQWVQDARSRGVASMDVGCLQINLFFHPSAFETLDFAFDPSRNAGYAARFLLQLYAETQDWEQAIGFYHSHTPAFATRYQQQVQQLMSGTLTPARTARPVTLAGQLGLAWRATFGQPNPAPPHGAGWDILLTSQVPPLQEQSKKRVQWREPAPDMAPRRMVSELHLPIQELTR